MVNHRAAAALLLIASLFVVVAISRADARPTVDPNKMAVLRRDVHMHGRVYMEDAPAAPGPESKPTCDNCDKRKPEPEPEPEPEHKTKPQPEAKPELTCKKVHGVRAGETCCSVGEGAGLTQDQFLGFNPNLCCEKLFVGQWVCLEACHD